MMQRTSAPKQKRQKELQKHGIRNNPKRRDDFQDLFPPTFEKHEWSKENFKLLIFMLFELLIATKTSEPCNNNICVEEVWRKWKTVNPKWCRTLPGLIPWLLHTRMVKGNLGKSQFRCFPIPSAARLSDRPFNRPSRVF